MDLKKKTLSWNERIWNEEWQGGALEQVTYYPHPQEVRNWDGMRARGSTSFPVSSTCGCAYLRVTKEVGERFMSGWLIYSRQNKSLSPQVNQEAKLDLSFRLSRTRVTSGYSDSSSEANSFLYCTLIDISLRWFNSSWVVNKSWKTFKLKARLSVIIYDIDFYSRVTGFPFEQTKKKPTER